MKNKVLITVIEIHEEAIEVMTSLEKRLFELRVSHRIEFKNYGNVEVTMELPYNSTVARGYERLIITVRSSSNGYIRIPTDCIDSINIETGHKIFG